MRKIIHQDTLTHGQARSEKTVTEIFLEVLMARVFVGLLKSRRAAAALARGIIFCDLLPPKYSATNAGWR